MSTARIELKEYFVTVVFQSAEAKSR